MQNLAHTRSASENCSGASEESDEPRWAGWLLALVIYAIYAVIASPVLASLTG
ncbi:MAG: hypothetical protein GVY16_10660 [Planctomycetes bacterium]|jgi:hypothetical protein|nr:hypothetical protein [Planctomycetota bacterium]